MVQCLGRHAPTAGVRVRSLVRELRSHMLHGAAKKVKNHESNPVQHLILIFFVLFHLLCPLPRSFQGSFFLLPTLLAHRD